MVWSKLNGNGYYYWPTYDKTLTVHIWQAANMYELLFWALSDGFIVFVNKLFLGGVGTGTLR